MQVHGVWWGVIRGEWNKNGLGAPNDHSVDGVLQVEDFSAGIDFDLLGEVAECDGLCYLCDGTDLDGCETVRAWDGKEVT